MMYSINVKFQAKAMQKLNLDKFIAENFPGYRIGEYAKNEKGYSVLLVNSVETTDISNAITEIAEVLDQENSMNKDLVEILAYEITEYEQMQMPTFYPEEKKIDAEMKRAFKKAGKIADIIIEKSKKEKEKAK